MLLEERFFVNLAGKLVHVIIKVYSVCDKRGDLRISFRSDAPSTEL